MLRWRNSRAGVRCPDGVGPRAGHERTECIAGFLAYLRETLPDERLVRAEPAGAFAGAAGCGEIGDAFTGFGEEELRLSGVGKRGEQGGDFFRSASGEQGGGEREGEFEALRIAGERAVEALGCGGGMSGVEQEVAAEEVQFGIGRVAGESAVEPGGGSGDVAGVERAGSGAEGDLEVEFVGFRSGRALEKGRGICLGVRGPVGGGGGVRGLGVGVWGPGGGGPAR